MRKVYLIVHCEVIIEAEEGISISEIMDEMDYNFISQTDNVAVADTEMLDYDIIDSK